VVGPPGLEPGLDRYERGYFFGNIDKIWRFSSRQPTNVLVQFTSFIGEALVGVFDRPPR
jgi:hypothetical protein